MTNISALCSRLFAKREADLVAKCGTSACQGLVLQRAFDGTPVMCKFGTMQQHFFQSARYLKPIPPDREGGYTRWTTQTYSEWAKSHPRAVSSDCGVLEVFTMNMNVSMPQWTPGSARQDPTKSDYQEFHQPCVYPLVVLKSGTASTMFNAIEISCNNLGHPQLLNIARDMDSHGAVLILEDLLDSCKANLLLKKCVASLFEDCPNALYSLGLSAVGTSCTTAS